MMIKNLLIVGDVNNPCKNDVKEGTTIKELLEGYAGGIKNNKQIKLAQIGGALGVLIDGNEIGNELGQYQDFLDKKMIMFFGEIFCPVDYLRFITRYAIRELRVDTPLLRQLNNTIEMIAQGKSDTLEALYSSTDTGSTGEVEGDILKIFKYIVDNFEDDFIQHVRYKKCKHGICRGLFISQCVNACPADVHVPGYIELMKKGDMENAYHLMRKNNPLSFVCGKICARPCEERCRRGEIESTVGVRALKHYASDVVSKMDSFEEDKMPYNGKTVAIIGAGPAGLSSAYFLARSGYAITIYEANEVVGGMLATGIPEFRLEQSVIDHEVELIKNLGVKILTKTKVGVDISFDEIEKNNDALLIATGLQRGVKLGPDSEQIETAIDFLKAVKVNKREGVGQSVVVIGGGDVAIDTARTAVRLGAKKVTIVSLESKNEMPASVEEIEEALEEDIRIINNASIHEYMLVDNQLTGIVLKECLSIVDTEGRFNPTYDESHLRTLNADHILYAIGQKADNRCFENKVDIRHKSILTSNEKVFAAGDVIEAGIAIKAIAEARDASALIDEYLGGDGLYLGEEIAIPESPLNCQSWDIEQSVEEKNNGLGFNAIKMVFDEETAQKEASRCMRCDRNSTKPLFLRRF